MGDDETGSAEDQIAQSEDFLMTIMEWNEIVDTEEGRTLEVLRSDITDRRIEVLKSLSVAFQERDKDGVTENIAKLNYMDNLLEKLKYKID